MNKLKKQKIHREFMQTKMHDAFRAAKATYHDFGTQINNCYWFQFSKLSEGQMAIIRDAHPMPDLVQFRGMRSQYAPELKSVLFTLNY